MTEHEPSRRGDSVLAVERPMLIDEGGGGPGEGLPESKTGTEDGRNGQASANELRDTEPKLEAEDSRAGDEEIVNLRVNLHHDEYENLKANRVYQM